MSFNLVIDCETTGLDIINCDITEISMLLYNGEESVSSFNIKMDPSKESHKYLKALQITKRNLDTEYYSQDLGFNELMKYMTKEMFPIIGNKKITIIGHNISFDIQLVRNFLEKYNIFGWNEIFNVSVIDTSTIGNFLRDCGVIKLDKMSLMNLAECLGIEIDKNLAHGAKYDTEITWKCYLKMKKLLESINKNALKYESLEK